MNIDAFLNPVKPENIRVVISNRFKDENGNPVEWELRALSQDENNALMKKYTKRDKKGTETFDRTSYVAALTAAGVVEPDLNNAKLQDAYGVLGADKLLCKMLLIGEYGELVSKVQELSGLDQDINVAIEEAKN